MNDILHDFLALAPKVFNDLLEENEYALTATTINHFEDMEWSAHLIYTHSANNLQIKIKQEPYYTDYGFSFEIHQLSTHQYNLIYRVEREQQDSKYAFLNEALNAIQNSELALKLIRGLEWVEWEEVIIKS